jgi:hypothetical protein
VYCKHLYYVFRFLCKVDYDIDKFIHAPSYFYNEVMRLLELSSVVFNRVGAHFCRKGGNTGSNSVFYHARLGIIQLI